MYGSEAFIRPIALDSRGDGNPTTGLPGRDEDTIYELSDAALGAFAVFFMQSASFLAYQRDMQRTHGHNNAQSLFGIEQVPSDPHIRNLLDPIAPEHLGWSLLAHL